MKAFLILLLIVSVFVSACAVQEVGNDRDENGCIASAGYTWCESRQECLRSWEDTCPASNEDQVKELALAHVLAMDHYKEFGVTSPEIQSIRAGECADCWRILVIYSIDPASVIVDETSVTVEIMIEKGTVTSALAMM